MLPAGSSLASEMPPLIGIARWISGRLAFTTSGEVITAYTLTAPADSPINVTLPGLPPKLAMLPLTNFSALMMSRIAKSPESLSGSPFFSTLALRKPNMPSR